MSAIGKAVAKPKVVSKGPPLIKTPEEMKGATGVGRKLSDRKTTAELQAEIKEYLSDLAASTDPDEKKRIRRALRVRGHRGGLGEKKLITTPDAEIKDTKVVAAKPKPKGKRAAPAKNTPSDTVDAK